MRRLCAASALSLCLLMLLTAALPGASAQAAGLWGPQGIFLISADQARPVPDPDERHQFQEEVGKRRAQRVDAGVEDRDTRSDTFDTLVARTAHLTDARRAPVPAAHADSALGTQPRLRLSLQLGQAP